MRKMNKTRICRETNDAFAYWGSTVVSLTTLLPGLLGLLFSPTAWKSSTNRLKRKQYDRFAKLLQRVMVEFEPVAVHLSAMDTTPSMYGSHSARKGSATYVSSCSTASPAASAICLRAGWSLPGVQDTYIRFEAAGDMMVGRCVSGLPFDDVEFATLPPFFERRHSVVKNAMDACFPTAPEGMWTICEFLLASLVFHYDYLQTNLCQQHPLFATVLFRDQEWIEGLRPLVVCRRGTPTDRIRPTRLPQIAVCSFCFMTK